MSEVQELDARRVANDSAPAESPLLREQFAGTDGSGLSDAQLIEEIRELERLKAACAAAQVRLTARFVATQAAEAARLQDVAQECSDAGDFDGWVAARDRARSLELPPEQGQTGGRASRAGSGSEEGSGSGAQERRRKAGIMARTGVSAQIGLARCESPTRGARLARAAVTLVEHLPHTLAALTEGLITERRAELVVKGTSHLSPELRAQVDADVIGANLDPDGKPGSGVSGWGDREVERRVKACADALDPEAAAERARSAEKDRHVSIRPIPDCMAVLCAVLPVAQAVAIYAVLLEAAASAKAAGDPRTRGQVMADTLFERVTGLATADDVDVEVQVVITDRALFDGDDTPAHVPGYGSVPAGWVRDLFNRHGDPHGDRHGDRHGDGDPPESSSPPDPPDPRAREAKRWLRRFYTHPRTGTLVGMDSKRRLFPDALRAYLVARDGVCRTPWCNAPIRHADHVTPHSQGGPTTDTNGQGLCVACNLTKDLPGWSSRVVDPGPTAGSDNPHTVEMTTPTGHTYTSSAPPVLPGLSKTHGDAEAGSSEVMDTQDCESGAGAMVIELYRIVPAVPETSDLTHDSLSPLEARLAELLAS